jgi:hypothetical protein
MTFVSYPGPDRSIRLEDLETGHFAARRYRNRRIGEFLKEMKLTEGRGTGIPKILKAMKANGSPKPRFETDDDRTYFVATFQGKIKGKQGQVRVTGEVTGEVAGEVTGEVLKFLAILNSPLTRMEIQKSLGPKGQANFRDRYLRPSLALGVVEMTIPDKPNSRFQRYQITAKGRQLIKAGNFDETWGNKKPFWPFDGWDIPDERSVVAEVYPVLWSRNYPKEGRTPDQHDAYSVAAWLRRADLDGTLSECFKPSLTPTERAIAPVEGWILGIK